MDARLDLTRVAGTTAPPTASMSTQCPSCRRNYYHPPRMVGTTVRCPTCNFRIKLGGAN